MRAAYRATAMGLLLAGCAHGAQATSGRRPSRFTPSWRDTSLALRDSSYANIPWWGVLRDTTLQGLIRIALRENRDLHIALARVNEARALLGIQRLEFWPQIDVHGRIGKAEGSDSLLSGVGSNELGFLGATLSWELDLWGRLRRLNESAQASLLATEQGRRGVIMIVVSEVARAYLELLDLDAQVAIADSQVSIRQQSLELAQSRFKGGLTSELDVSQGENSLAIAEGTRSRTLRLRTQKENELSVLLGRPPRNLPRGPSADAAAVPQRDPGRPAVRTAGAAPRRAAGGGAAARRQCQDRGRDRRALPHHLADRRGWDRQRRPRQPVRVRDRLLQHRGQPAGADHQLGSQREAGRRGASPYRGSRGTVRAHRPHRLSGGRGRAGVGAAAARGGRRGRRAPRLRLADPSSWRASATRAGWTTISTCSTRSGHSSMPSCRNPSCSSSSGWRWCSCTARSAADGTR